MTRNSKHILSTALASFALFSACDKGALPRGEPASEASQELNAAPSSAASVGPGSVAAPSPMAAAPEAGATLRHLPESCTGLKLYVNLERFGKYYETGADIAGVAAMALAKTDADEKYIAPLIASLQKHGVSLTKDLVDVAACAQSQTDWIALLAVNLSELKIAPSQLLAESVGAAGQKDAKIRSESGVEYVVPQASGGALGFVAPGVLAFASSASLLAKAATTNTQGLTMGDSESHLATVLFPAGGERASVTLTGDQKNLTAALHLPLNEEQRAELKKGAVKYLASLRGAAEKRLGGNTMEKLQAPELKQFFQDFNRLDMSVTKETLDVKLTVSIQQIRDAVAAVAKVTPANLEQIVKAAEK